MEDTEGPVQFVCCSLCSEPQPQSPGGYGGPGQKSASPDRLQSSGPDLLLDELVEPTG